MKKKRISGFRDWNIQVKILVVMLLLSWLPVLLMLVMNLQNQVESSITEIENFMLKSVADTVIDFQNVAIKFIDDNHDVIEDISREDIVISYLVQEAEQEPDPEKPPRTPLGGGGGGGEGGEDSGSGESEDGDLPPPPDGELLPPPDDGGGQSPSPDDGGGQSPPPGGDSPPPTQDSGGPLLSPVQESHPPGEGEETLSLELEAIVELLIDWVNTADGIQDIILYNPLGVAVASSEPHDIGNIDIHRPDVSTALSGTSFTEGLRMSPIGDVPGFFISVPVLFGDNVVGSISARLDGAFIVEELTENSEEVPAGETAENIPQSTIMLVDSHGLVMVHSDPNSDWLYRSLIEQNLASLAEIEQFSILGGTCPDGGFDCDPRTVISRAPVTIASAQPLGDEVMTVFTEDNEGGTLRYCHPAELESELELDDCLFGEWNSAAYEATYDPISGKALFVIVVHVSEGSFFSAVNQERTLSIVGGSVLGVVLVLASLLVARTMARPLRRLASAAVSVENEEDFEPETIADVTEQRDEVGKLARVFSNMVVALQEREKKLKEKVQKLRVQIDQNIRKKDVEDISKGEFFQNLRSKSKQMREDFKDDPDGTENGNQ